MPRKTVYSVALVSCWGPSHLAAAPNLLKILQTSLCSHPLPFTSHVIFRFLLGLSPVRGEGKLRQRAL